MTEKELGQYKALKARIERNEIKIESINAKDVQIVDGKVKGSSKHFPYIETHYHVQMYEPKEMDEQTKKINQLKMFIESDKKRIREIENFINNIEDPELQTIFEMRIYDKRCWIDIAEELGDDKDRTTYSKRFKHYLDNSHNSPLSQNRML